MDAHPAPNQRSSAFLYFTYLSFICYNLKKDYEVKREGEGGRKEKENCYFNPKRVTASVWQKAYGISSATEVALVKSKN